MTTAHAHIDGGCRMRRCPRCKRYRLIKFFGPNRAKRANGLDGYCVDCRRGISRDSARKRRADPANKDYFRDYDLRKRFGITLADYERMYAEQEGLCAICGDGDGKTLQVDHCHGTEVVRGLLCGPCNRGLECFRDDPSRLLSAVEYLA